MFINLLLYHYFLAHFAQYWIHYSFHHKIIPKYFYSSHILHHVQPNRTTWYGETTGASNSVFGIYHYAGFHLLEPYFSIITNITSNIKIISDLAI